MYTFDSRVRYSEIDESGNLSVTSAVNYFQDCSTFQSEDIGKGVGYLKEHHKAWWLSSWQIVFDRFPKLGEKIVIGTYPYGFKGAYGYRNFLILDESGNYLVRANSVWFLFDLEAGRPVRVQEDDIRGYGEAGAKPLEMEYATKRIAVPEDYREDSPVEITRHYIDTNHHVNNARYAEIAMESLPRGFSVGELRIEYKKAAMLGDTVIPRVGESGEGIAVDLRNPSGDRYAVTWFREKKG